MDLQALPRAMPLLHPLFWLVALMRLAGWGAWRPAHLSRAPGLTDSQLEALTAAIRFDPPRAVPAHLRACRPHPADKEHPDWPGAAAGFGPESGPFASLFLAIRVSGDRPCLSAMSAWPAGRRRAGPDPGRPHAGPNPT